MPLIKFPSKAKPLLLLVFAEGLGLADMKLIALMD
jgi:hypothetical protein